MLWQFQVNGEGIQLYIHMYPFSPKPHSHSSCSQVAHDLKVSEINAKFVKTGSEWKYAVDVQLAWLQITALHVDDPLILQVKMGIIIPQDMSMVIK